MSNESHKPLIGSNVFNSWLIFSFLGKSFGEVVLRVLLCIHGWKIMFYIG